MKRTTKIRIWQRCYLVLLIAFSVYILLDAFVIQRIEHMRAAIENLAQALPDFTPLLTISGIILAVGLVFDISIRAVGSRNRP